MQITIFLAFPFAKIQQIALFCILSQAIQKIGSITRNRKKKPIEEIALHCWSSKLLLNAVFQ